MIHTLTLNPSLDYVTDVKHLRLGEINRSFNELIFPGGKGINVSQILKHLGMKSRALGFIAGFSGRHLAEVLQAMDVETDFLELSSGMTRINVKIRSDGETAVNAAGPTLSPVDLDALKTQLTGLTSDDVLVLAGNLPKGVPDTLYCEIAEPLCRKGIPLILDAEGRQLRSVLKHHPFLIKPNHEELGALFGESVRDADTAFTLAKRLQDEGARHILISMGKDGALFLSEDGARYRVSSPTGIVKNTVGAGDSMVAGFLYGYLTEGNFRDALRYGAAAGSATAFSDGLADGELIRSLLNQVHIEEVTHENH